MRKQMFFELIIGFKIAVVQLTVGDIAWHVIHLDVDPVHGYIFSLVRLRSNNGVLAMYRQD